MDNWILRNWLILSIAALLVGFWISFFEDFVTGKAYLFFILSIVFFLYWLRKKGKI
jgi:hypothetical protein